MKENKILEEYVREVTGKPFEFIITNHTKTIDTNLSINSALEDFYYTSVEPSFKYTTTLI
jgi:hypothetical protein